MMNTKIKSPVLRYHGGKFLLSDWIIGHFPKHRTYVEPFGGAASVLLRKPRSSSEVLNDLNDDLVNLFQVLRNKEQAENLIEQLRLTPYAYTEYKASLEAATEPIERARRLVVSSFMGIGSDGSTRGSSAGFRNYSRVDKIGSLPAHQWSGFVENMWAIVARLEGVIIECRDAVHVIKQHDSDSTLHYADPPYVHSSRSEARGRYKFEMTDDDHRILAKCWRSVKGMVVLSGYPCELYDKELYADWFRVERAAMADGARKRTEVLWFNKAAQERMPQGTLLQFEVASC